MQATASPVATGALRRIAEFYVIEAAIRGQTADARQSMRRSKSLPLVTSMKAWLEIQLVQIPPRSGLAEPKPFTWTADPNKIIRAVRREHQVLDSTH